ncbi:MAG: HD domain-containing protein [Clostridiales bacterium]|nr:HD domain-containing protein [Clostridiales bacterium]
MTNLCLALVLIGAIIMGCSILDYYRVLEYMKKQAYEKKIFNNKIYIASFIMMVFFFIGYIFTGFVIKNSEFHFDQLLISLIFFFGAIFVLCMVTVQWTMAKTISNKTTELIQSMIYSVEAKDLYTKGHSEHVFKLVVLFYNYLPQDIKSNINYTKLSDAALLHDIGKIGIPDGILNKPGKLNEEEWEIIRGHPKNAKSILEKTSYREISDMVLYHHERIDGNGYYKIPEHMIPLESKIIAIADTFSALYTDRVYRKKFPFDKAISILKEASGTQLDSKLVDIFCSIPEEEFNNASVDSI